ncbi:MAG: DUF1573 domain-containing protein [Phycisphaerales bacterium]
MHRDGPSALAGLIICGLVAGGQLGCTERSDNASGGDAEAARAGQVGLTFPEGTSIEHPRVDLESGQGSGVPFRWSVKNDSNLDVTVTRMVASCGCVNVEPTPPFTITSGRSAEIRATMAVSEAGMNRQSISIMTDSAEPVVLHAAVTVDPGFGISFDRSTVRGDSEDLFVRARMPAGSQPRRLSVRFVGDDAPIWSTSLVGLGLPGSTDEEHSIFIASIPVSELPGSRTRNLEVTVGPYVRVIHVH